MNRSHSPRRVVSLQPSATVILEAIGQLDCVIACTRYCVDVCPEVETGRTIVDDSWTADATEIIAAKPDLVIAAVPYQEKSISEILKSGARFLGLAPKTLSDIYTDIVAIAGIVGVPKRGEEAVSAMQAEIDRIHAQAAGLPRLHVFCEEWPKPLIASQVWVAELVEVAGGSFVGVPGVQTTADSVAAADPDVLIAAWCGAGDRVPLEKIVRGRAWTNLRAVREGRVHCIRAAAIHPERFPHAPGLRCITDVTREPSPPGAPVV
ncbi:MAG: Fe3+-hydroxamate ABC transporter substrate-binding protein [Acidobacteria bacterium]|nr:MAG: Fe3+-hydroxamate ABC transporter substrate-binding protein [Acidobacteriota bacterium]